MIKSVRLQNFRLYRDRLFEFEPGVNLITGPNGSGKTTVLEAIYMTLRGGSWRGADDQVIRKGADWARVDVTDSEGDVYTLKLDNRNGRLKKSRTKNKSRLVNPLKVVLFEPEFILTFTAEPDRRRQWVDDLLEQVQPSYQSLRKNYQRALRQRNRLLKQPEVSQDNLFVWDLKLSEYGGEIARARSRLIEEINTEVQNQYQSLSNDSSKITLKYAYSFPLEVYTTAFLAKLEENRARDKIIGFTTAGPHREDIQTHINEEPFSSTASRGEVRTLAMALKRLEKTIIASEGKLIEMYDDAFSELDESRQTSLLQQKPYQRIISSVYTDNTRHNKHITL